MPARLIGSLALVAVAGAFAVQAREVESQVDQLMALRLALLRDPAAARAEFCASPGVDGTYCHLTARAGTIGGPVALCSAAADAKVRRRYVLRLACRLPKPALGHSLPLLETSFVR